MYPEQGGFGQLGPIPMGQPPADSTSAAASGSGSASASGVADEPTRPLPTVGAPSPLPGQHLPQEPLTETTAPLRHTLPGYTREYPHVPHHHGGSPSARRSSRGPILISLVVLLIAGLGGAALAGAWTWYGWGTTLPESVLPGSSVAFARIDLSPGLGQRRALDSLARKFPAVTDDRDAFVERLIRGVVIRAGLNELSYDADIKPWFAGRIGVALWPADPTGRQLCVLVATASKDDRLASAALARLRQQHSSRQLGVRVTDGYAIVARCQAQVDAQVAVGNALAEASAASLARHGEFAHQVDALPAGQTVLAYADFDRARTLVPDLVDDAIDDDIATLVTTSLTEVTGQVVIGVRATDVSVEIRYRWRDHVSSAGGRDVLSTLDALPGTTAIGLCADFRSSDVAAPLRRQLARGIDGVDSRFGAGLSGLLNSVLSVSISNLGGSPMLLLLAQATSADEATDIADMLKELDRDRQAMDGAAVEVFDDRVSVASRGYREGGDTLRDTALYRQTMAGATGTSTFAAFVDMSALIDGLDLDPATAVDLRPIKAVGLTAGRDGDTSVALVRLVVG